MLTPFYSLVAHLKETLDLENPPWANSSTFSRLVQRISDWRTYLPARLTLTADQILARSLSGEETPLAMLHAWYHAAMWELHGVWMNPRHAEAAPAEWLERMKRTCVEHAQALGGILATYDLHLPAHVLIDPSLPLLVHESIKIQLLEFSGDPADMDLADRQTLGARFDRMCAHIFRSARLIWSSGYTVG
jgi:hypothetical protein